MRRLARVAFSTVAASSLLLVTGSSLGSVRSVSRAGALAAAVAEEFALVGVNGLDFVAHEDVPWPVEVNPRPTASMELAERWYGLSIFAAHAAASGRSRSRLRPRRGASARRCHRQGDRSTRGTTVLAPDLRSWLDDPWVRDIPHEGERMARGAPVCTVFAIGSDSADCYRALVRRADRLYSEWGIGRRTA